MWLLVLGIPLGIIVAVFLLPAVPFLIGSIVVALALSLLVLYLYSICRRQAEPPRMSRVIILLAAVMLGLGLGAMAQQRFSAWQLQPNQPYYLTGEITGIPRIGKFSIRYRINASCLGGDATSCDYFKRILPVWPVFVDVIVPRKRLNASPGEIWQIEVQQKVLPERHSPASFDVSRWLRSTHTVARLGLAKGGSVTLQGNRYFSMDAVRTKLNRHLAGQAGVSSQRALSSIPVLLALVSGDRSLMSDQHWQVFNRTGTTHLVAISGLHIGLVAAFVIWVMNPVFRRWRWLTSRYPASHGSVIVAWCVAALYTGLAGFALPTQRALIMLTVFVVLKLLGRAQQLWFGLALAFCLVLLWDPVACLSLGFWLSFVAVYLILWLIGGAVLQAPSWKQWTMVQLGLFIGLAPVLLWQVQSISLVSVFTNVFAIPVIGFVAVPVALLWASVWSVAGDQAVLLLSLAVQVVDLLMSLLQWCAQWRFSSWGVSERSMLSMLLAMVGVLWLISAGVPGRLWGLVLMLPLVLPQTHGLGLYLMGTSVPQLVFHLPDRVVVLSKSHWPHLIPSWHQKLLSHWGIGVPMTGFPLQNTSGLWLASSAVITEYRLSTSALNHRQVETVRYYDLCAESNWHFGELALMQWHDVRYPHYCASTITLDQQRWLYWPTESIRSQRTIYEQLKTRHSQSQSFAALIAAPKKSQRLETSVLDLLQSQSGMVVSVKPLPATVQKLVTERELNLFNVMQNGFLYRPLQPQPGEPISQTFEITAK